MANVPETFKNISPVIASYDFQDIVSATGYVLFYAGTTVDKKLLSNFTYFSDVTTVSGGNNSNGVYALVTDTDFDVLINRPLDIKGLGIVTVPFEIGAGNNQYPTGYVTVKLRKWDGATETLIVTNDSRVYTATGNYDRILLTIDLDIPLTHFKIGEYLRLTIEVYGKTVGTASVFNIACDPKDRSSNYPSNQLTFQCPTRLNL